MAGRAWGSPAHRIVALAAYVKSRAGTQVTLGDITHSLPGYDDGSTRRDDRGELVEGTKEWETLRKKLQRDCFLELTSGPEPHVINDHGDLLVTEAQGRGITCGVP